MDVPVALTSRLKDESARADVPGDIDIHAVKIIKGLSGVPRGGVCCGLSAFRLVIGISPSIDRVASPSMPPGWSGVVVAVDRLLAAPGEIEQAFDRRAGPFNHSLIDNNLVAPLLKQG